MASEPSPKRVKLSAAAGDFVCDANEIVTFRLVQQKDGDLLSDINAGGEAFHPLMCHQHFGEQEEIKGYTGLTIDIWMSARTGHMWIDTNWDHKRAIADDLTRAFENKFPGGYALDKAQFIDTVQSAVAPDIYNLGEHISSTNLADGSELRVQLHHLSTADKSIQDLHQRIESLLLFFIDAASFIDKDDPNWDLLLAVRRQGGHDVLVGFATVYKFFAFPDRHRLRLSQLLVLPPYQGQGVGRCLLLAAYKMAGGSNATDLTLEDPTDELRRIREKVDLQKLAALDWMKELAQKTANAACEQPAVEDTSDGSGNGKAKKKRHPLALSPADISRAQEESKIHKSSVKDLWEALVFAHLPGGGKGAGVETVASLVGWRLRCKYMGAPLSAAEGKIVLESGQDGVFEMIRGEMPQMEGEQEGGEGTVSVGGGRSLMEMDAAKVDKEVEALLVERMERLQVLAGVLT